MIPRPRVCSVPLSEGKFNYRRVLVGISSWSQAEGQKYPPVRAYAVKGSLDVLVLPDVQKMGDLLGGYLCVRTSASVSSRSFSEPVSNITGVGPKLQFMASC